jgi:hypothetical protein
MRDLVIFLSPQVRDLLEEAIPRSRKYKNMPESEVEAQLVSYGCCGGKATISALRAKLADFNDAIAAEQARTLASVAAQENASPRKPRRNEIFSMEQAQEEEARSPRARAACACHVTGP